MSSDISGDHTLYSGPIPNGSMRAFLFLSQGRIARGRFWLGALAVLLYAAVAAVAVWVLWLVFPGESDDGSFNVTGVQAVPYLAVVLAYLVLSVWTGICLGVKRYHDRGKSGAWVLVQFVPCIGTIWYFIEAGCLRGTIGPNPYGPDPLA